MPEPVQIGYRDAAGDFDSETSLYYYRARYYDSNAGRFSSEDPGFGLFGGTLLKIFQK